MQKWCPEAFDAPATGGLAVAAAAFEPEARPVNGGDAAKAFRSEAGFATPESLLGNLTQKERTQLFELVEQDVSREYQEREEGLRREFEARSAEMADRFEATLINLGRQLQSAQAELMNDISAASARLAVQLAAKIVRNAVSADSGVLVRALETIQFKLAESAHLTVSLNPADAAWLEGRTELLRELNITQIQPDRRIEQGGCIARAAGHEWDATIGRQLESLTEIVEEAIATAGEASRSDREGEALEPGRD